MKLGALLLEVLNCLTQLSQSRHLVQSELAE
jgi:hypothetical protein